MAKGSLFTGVMTGKLGNAVLFRIKNSNSKEKQGTRSYVARIANPQSQGQARQRLCLSNIVQNYKQLREVIRRGFEGVPYGGESYNKYLKLNMPNYNGAYVDKGVQNPVPFSAIISQGSLMPVGVLQINTEKTNTGVVLQQGIVTDISWPNAVNVETYGQMWARIVRSNAALQDGDQLTFVQVSVVDNGSFIYRTNSMTIDVEDTTPFDKGVFDFDDISYAQVFATKLDDNKEYLSFNIDQSNSSDEVTVAGACIISRNSGNGTYLRSNATLEVDFDNEFVGQYYSPNAYASALASYMNVSADAVDWPVQPDAEQENTAGLVSLAVTINIPEGAIAQGSEAKTIETSVLGYRDNSGTSMLTRTKDGTPYCLNNKGEIQRYVFRNEQKTISIEPRWVTPKYATKQYYTRYGTL